MSYSYTEFLASQYADTTITEHVALVENTCYAVKMLGLDGVTMVADPPDDTITIATSFSAGADRPSLTEAFRVVNCFIALEDGVATVVLPDTYDSLLEGRLESLIDALADGDSTAAYQYISMLSSQTKNKLAEHNQHREYKSRRQKTVTPWQL